MELIKWKRGGQWVDNDEGYHYKYCGACGGQAEHDFNGCVDCHNRTLTRKRTKTVGKYTVTRYAYKTTCTCQGYRYRKTCRHIKETTF